MSERPRASAWAHPYQQPHAPTMHIDGKVLQLEKKVQTLEAEVARLADVDKQLATALNQLAAIESKLQQQGKTSSDGTRKLQEAVITLKNKLSVLEQSLPRMQQRMEQVRSEGNTGIVVAVVVFVGLLIAAKFL